MGTRPTRTTFMQVNNKQIMIRGI
ncbi:uncharacterized protein G2W53_014195 [Senna tora]|uniref:Uncharacterized protein n=1 Tax=Senna tora TaxID=362788 RepID=A0A834WT25_9FABA|nr:uncharacterized protein G2W53_014195 [Senna tora]